jgi:hypothetical protein
MDLQQEGGARPVNRPPHTHTLIWRLFIWHLFALRLFGVLLFGI